MDDTREQLKIAEKFGYVESRGGSGVERGNLVPFDHHSSPLSLDQIRNLRKRGFEPGKIYPKES